MEKFMFFRTLKIKIVLGNIFKKAGYRLIRINEESSFEKHGSNSHILENGSFFLKSLLKKHKTLKIEKYKNGFLFIINNIKHYVTSSEEIYILNEIYADECYMIIGKEKSYNVIDIGTNVGFSALFFAQLSSVKKVYGFEPVTKTYSQALENFSLNPECANIIETFNFGIGKENRIDEFIYNKNFKGSVGLVDANFKVNHDAKNELVEVKIKGVNQTISDIISRHPSEKFILKIDCEGAEFEIIESLSINNNLNKFEIIILEWHIKKPDTLISWLIDANFVIHLNSKKETLGLLYAFKI